MSGPAPVVSPGPQDVPRAAPPASPPQARSEGPWTWARRNLFRGPIDAVVSVVGAVVGAYVVFRVVRFVLVTGRWDVVRVNLKLLMVGRFPDQHLPRVSVSLVVLVAVGGVLTGCVHRRQVLAGTSPTAGMSAGARARDLVGRFAAIGIVGALLLGLTDSTGPWILAGAMVLGAVVGRLLGGVVPPRAHPVVVVGALATPFILVAYLADAVGWDDWGGLMLNIFIAVTAIVLCFPVGVVAALGRRSTLPVVSWLSTIYIELLRAAPLFVLLLMANVALGFFVPEDQAPGKVARAIIVFTLFTGAYMAEIIRGGLQSLPPGQEEAGRALGLPPWKVTFLIVLPQALRNVIPAQVGQLISLFKDTTLAGAAMTLFEILLVSTAITAQGPFAGQALLPETLAFVGLMFWVGSFTMSRESQRIERRLGVGQR